MFQDMFEVCVVTLRINVTRYRLESVTYTGFKAFYLFPEEVWSMSTASIRSFKHTVRHLSLSQTHVISLLAFGWLLAFTNL